MAQDGLRRENLRVKNLDVSGTLTGVYSNGGKTYYVDSALTATGDGLTWEGAFITIAEAVAKSLADGGHQDTILVRGTDNEDSDTDPVNDYAETVTIAASQVGLRIIGCGNGPEGVKWTVGTQDEIILTINAIDCVVENIRFRPNGATTGAAIYLAAAVDLAANANGTQIRNCIFRSTTETALAGIWTEGASDCLVEDCLFTSLVNGIYETHSPAHVVYRMVIRNNRFDDKMTNGIVIGGRSCLIENNMLATGMTKDINTAAVTPAACKNNVVRGHQFTNAVYETGCTGTTTDIWFDNVSLDVGSSAVSADGTTNLKVYPQA